MKESVSVEIGKSRPVRESVGQGESSLYVRMMDEGLLEMLGPSRSSWVLGMRSICRAKRIA